MEDLIIIITCYIVMGIFVCYKMFKNSSTDNSLKDYLAISIVFLLWWFPLSVMILNGIALAFLGEWDEMQSIDDILLNKKKGAN